MRRRNIFFILIVFIAYWAFESVIGEIFVKSDYICENIFYNQMETGYNELIIMNENNYKGKLFAENRVSNEGVTGDNGKIEKVKSSVNEEGDKVLIKVTIIVLFIWFALSLFLFRIDRRISKLEKIEEDE